MSIMKKNWMALAISTAAAVVVSAALATLSACKNQQPQLIEKVVFQPSQNLETVRVSLVFGDQVKTDLAGGFTIMDYGYFFVSPHTESQHFEVGFDINMSIFDEQDYVGVDPTTLLPNGMPIGLPNAVVQLSGPSPISPKFDLYGYVDLYGKSWLGLATMFQFLNNDYFPAGLTINQSFLPNDEGKPGMIASVFGAALNQDGSVLRNGGIALFANVRQLIEQYGHGGASSSSGIVIEGTPESLEVEGPAAPLFRNKPSKLLKLEQNLIRGFQGLKPLR
jgi:hypothetical protein